MGLSVLTDFEDNDVAIVRLEGDLVVSDIDKLRREIHEIIDKNVYKILIDMSEIDFIDSSGIGLLVEILKTISKYEGGQLKLVNLNRQVREILKQIQLYSIFDIYETEDEALESFN